MKTADITIAMVIAATIPQLAAVDDSDPNDLPAVEVAYIKERVQAIDGNIALLEDVRIPSDRQVIAIFSQLSEKERLQILKEFIVGCRVRRRMEEGWNVSTRALALELEGVENDADALDDARKAAEQLDSRIDDIEGNAQQVNETPVNEE